MNFKEKTSIQTIFSINLTKFVQLDIKGGMSFRFKFGVERYFSKPQRKRV